MLGLATSKEARTICANTTETSESERNFGSCFWASLCGISKHFGVRWWGQQRFGRGERINLCEQSNENSFIAHAARWLIEVTSFHLIVVSLDLLFVWIAFCNVSLVRQRPSRTTQGRLLLKRERRVGTGGGLVPDMIPETTYTPQKWCAQLQTRLQLRPRMKCWSKLSSTKPFHSQAQKVHSPNLMKEIILHESARVRFLFTSCQEYH